MDAANSVLTFNFQFFVKELEYKDDTTNGERCVLAVGITFLDFPPVVIYPQDSDANDPPHLSTHHSQRRLAREIIVWYIYSHYEIMLK